MSDSKISPRSSALSDDALAEAILKLTTSTDRVLIVANNYTVRVAVERNDGTWMDIGRGELGRECRQTLTTFIKAELALWHETPGTPADANISSISGQPVTLKFVNAWIKNAELLAQPKGRGSSPRKKDMEHLGYLSAWRCQFSGCGKDLKRGQVSGTGGRFSYFSHIVASSPDGPRGDAVLSSELADDIENVMLMCDECHRRIDRIEPDRFTVEVLQQMRQDNIRGVRRLLDALQYPEALPLVIMGNVGAQSPRFSQPDAEEAMWSRRLRASTTGHEQYFRNAGHLHDPHSSQYWGSLFVELKSDLPMIRKRLNGSLRNDGTATLLAVFPLHGTSVLVLAGRVIGEGSRITIFQYDRDKSCNAPGGNWAFDPNVATPRKDKYCLTELSPHRDKTEACLLVSLTYKISHNRLPAELFRNEDFALGTLEITLSDQEQLGYNVFNHSLDIDLFALTLERALRLLQDDWKVTRIHLFLGAPASACFKVGQKLQARNHSEIVCYESELGNEAGFLPTVFISNKEVRSAMSDDCVELV